MKRVYLSDGISRIKTAGPLRLNTRDPERLYKIGLSCLRQHMLEDAYKCFRMAFELRPADARYRSYYGLCMALVEEKTEQAISVCEQAVKMDFFQPELFCNLGRVYLMAGKRNSAFQVLQTGLHLDENNPEILSQLKNMGSRKSPVFPFLRRSHPVNAMAGRALRRLGLR